MIKKLDLQDVKTTQSVLKLQKTSYKIEAELMGFDDIPPLSDTLDSLMECEETFYGFYKCDLLAGIISYKVSDNTLDIHRVAVHPLFHRMGIAGKLIKHVEKLEGDIDRAIVCTGNKNTPAVNLYLKNGYEKVKDFEVDDGIYLTEFSKMY